MAVTTTTSSTKVVVGSIIIGFHWVIPGASIEVHGVWKATVPSDGTFAVHLQRSNQSTVARAAVPMDNGVSLGSAPRITIATMVPGRDGRSLTMNVVNVGTGAPDPASLVTFCHGTWHVPGLLITVGRIEPRQRQATSDTPALSPGLSSHSVRPYQGSQFLDQRQVSRAAAQIESAMQSVRDVVLGVLGWLTVDAVISSVRGRPTVPVAP